MSEDFNFDEVEFGEPIEEREGNFFDGYRYGLYKSFNIIDNQCKEIERLNKMLDEKFMKENPLLVENGIICKKNKEIERLHTIIKEVREYIKQNEFYLDYKTGACIKGVMPLLEILDKENK